MRLKELVSNIIIVTRYMSELEDYLFNLHFDYNFISAVAARTTPYIFIAALTTVLLTCILNNPVSEGCRWR